MLKLHTNLVAFKSCKIIEKLINKRLMKFLNEQKLNWNTHTINILSKTYDK